VASRVESHEGEIAIALNLANLLAVTAKLQILESDLVISLLTGPLKCFSPCTVTEPVADEVCVTLIMKVSLVGQET